MSSFVIDRLPFFLLCSAHCNSIAFPSNQLYVTSYFIHETGHNRQHSFEHLNLVGTTAERLLSCHAATSWMCIFRQANQAISICFLILKAGCGACIVNTAFCISRWFRASMWHVWSLADRTPMIRELKFCSYHCYWLAPRLFANFPVRCSYVTNDPFLQRVHRVSFQFCCWFHYNKRKEDDRQKSCKAIVSEDNMWRAADDALKEPDQLVLFTVFVQC